MMRKSRMGMFLIGLTALALSAGVVAGMLAARLPGSSSPPVDGVPPSPSSLLEGLNLNSDQQQQMREIWEGVRGNVHRTFNDAQDLLNKKDDELAELIPEDKRPQAKIIFKKYADKMEELKRKRDRLFDDGVAATNQILTSDQQKKYAEIRGKLHRPATQPTTVISTQEKSG